MDGFDLFLFGPWIFVGIGLIIRLYFNYKETKNRHEEHINDMSKISKNHLVAKDSSSITSIESINILDKYGRTKSLASIYKLPSQIAEQKNEIGKRVRNFFSKSNNLFFNIEAIKDRSTIVMIGLYNSSGEKLFYERVCVAREYPDIIHITSFFQSFKNNFLDADIILYRTNSYYDHKNKVKSLLEGLNKEAILYDYKNDICEKFYFVKGEKNVVRMTQIMVENSSGHFYYLPTIKIIFQNLRFISFWITDNIQFIEINHISEDDLTRTELKHYRDLLNKISSNWKKVPKSFIFGYVENDPDWEWVVDSTGDIYCKLIE